MLINTTFVLSQSFLYFFIISLVYINIINKYSFFVNKVSFIIATVNIVSFLIAPDNMVLFIEAKGNIISDIICVVPFKIYHVVFELYA